MASPSVGATLSGPQLTTPLQPSAGVAAGGPLENYANNSTPPSPKGPGTGSARARRYGRRSLLWDVSSIQRVRKCGRVTRSPDGLVGVMAGPNGAGLSGLCTCGSIWACPVCNAKVMARRALELGCAVAAWHAQGGATVFGTSTLRHHQGDRLAPLWDGLSRSWSDTTRGNPWLRRKESLGIAGFARAVEGNVGRNGWHVHLHWLLFVDGEVTESQVGDFGAWFASRWSRSVTNRGLRAPLAVGQDARLVKDVRAADLAAYVTKQTDLGLELTQSQSKRARDAHSTVPAWDLLTRIQDGGDADALDLWHEWEAASLGRRHLTWSQGFRQQLLGAAPEESDEEVAAQEDDGVTLLYITSEGWGRLVAAPQLIPRVLEAAEHSAETLRRLLDNYAIPYVTTKES